MGPNDSGSVDIRTCTGLSGRVSEVARRADVTMSGTSVRIKTHITVIIPALWKYISLKIKLNSPVMAHSHTRRSLQGTGPCPRNGYSSQLGMGICPCFGPVWLPTSYNCSHREIPWERHPTRTRLRVCERAIRACSYFACNWLLPCNSNGVFTMSRTGTKQAQGLGLEKIGDRRTLFWFGCIVKAFTQFQITNLLMSLFRSRFRPVWVRHKGLFTRSVF